MERLRQSASLRWLGIAAVYALTFFALHPKLLEGRFFLGWDALRHAWPNLEFVRHSIFSGELPLWNPWEKGGFSFVADPETGMLYPPFWLLIALGQFFGGGVWIMLINVVIHLLIAALGMHFYLKRLGFGEPAAFVGGASYVFSSRLAKSKDQTALGPSVWLPWMLIAVEELVRRPSWRTGTLLGTVVGFNVLSGYPPNVFRNLLVMAIIFGFELWTTLAASEDRRAHVLRVGRATLLGAVIAAALASPLLLAMSMIGSTAREGMSYAEVLRSTVRPWDALQLVAPGIRHHSSFLFYQGLVPALLALLALMNYGSRRLLWVIAGAVFFLLACGGHGPLLHALAVLVPGFSLFRVPELYLFGAIFFTAVLAARGLSDLLELPPDQRASWRQRVLLLTGAVLLVQVAALLVAAHGQRAKAQLMTAAGTSLVVLFFSTLLLVGLLHEGQRVRRVALWLLLPLLFLDLSIQNRPVFDILAPKPRFAREIPQLAKLQQPQSDVRQDVRIAENEHFGYRLSMRRNVRDFYGRRTALIGARYERYVKLSLGNQRLLAAANVRYFSGRGLARIKRQAPRSRTLVRGVVEFYNHAPFAYWVGRPTVMANEKAVLGALMRKKPGTAGLLERGRLSKKLQQRIAAMRSEAPPVKARLISLRRNTVKLAVDVPDAGLVVINERYAPGWRALVDGKPQRIHLANYLFRGLLVDKGLHEIELRYEPARVMIGLWIYLATCVLLLGSLGFWLMVSRRRRLAQCEQEPLQHE